jgi:hypothetical protein
MVILLLGERTDADGVGVLVWCVLSVNAIGLLVKVDMVAIGEDVIANSKILL